MLSKSLPYGRDRASTTDIPGTDQLISGRVSEHYLNLNTFFLMFMYYYYYYYYWLCWDFTATWAFSSCSEQGLLSSCSLRAPHCSGFSCWRARALGRSGFSSCGSWAPGRAFSSCGTQALLLHGVWDIPGPGMEPGSPALAGKFLTTEPPHREAPEFEPWLAEPIVLSTNLSLPLRSRTVFIFTSSLGKIILLAIENLHWIGFNRNEPTLWLTSGFWIRK